MNTRVLKMNTKAKGAFSCSFCGRPDYECEALVIGPVIQNTGIVVCICNDCAKDAFLEANIMMVKKD